MQKADSLEKMLMLGKIEGRRKRGWQWMKLLDGITDSMDMGLVNSSCCSVSKPHPALYDPWTSAHQTPLSSTVTWNLLKFKSFESEMLSNHLILCCPLLLPSVSPSNRVFSNELALYIRWPKYWSFRVSNSPSNEYSELTAFRIDWLDLLAVQETLKNLF